MSHEGPEKRASYPLEDIQVGGTKDVQPNLQGSGSHEGTGSPRDGEPADVGIPATDFTFDAINERLVRAGLKPFTREELRREAK